ncbi:SgcJ/EcaC family oxidoreductase [Flavobacterium sufflavum]|uniref:SgcJ/EcaC family oxidoreductase n=1 Tax=Flavobacterium sufflavum TaxID=1921138 RepID=A0A3S2XDV1_9FLAO|nr:SgcJ/EcaC family oxidoreductase [Flavobacterium sufflavum]RVT76445.1 SgcJ/EcaC family oxidoreductase [Flavobacterium sufflavum]
MKNATFLISVIGAFLAGVAVKTLMQKQNIEAMSEINKGSRKLDEQLIRKTEASYDSAWRQGNIESLMACFTDDPTLISPRGDEAFGTGQIRNLFTEFLGKEGKSTKHTGRIIRITFVTNDVAIVDGEAFIEGAENLSAAVTHHKFIDVLVRKGDTWLISQIRAFAIN